MKKTAVLIIILTIISKFFGFGRELVLSYLYGASQISDAYLIATLIPGVLLGVVSAGISAGYIPISAKESSINGEEGLNKFTNNIVTILLIIITIFMFFAFLFTEPLVRLFAIGFDSETLLLTKKFTRIAIFGMYFTGLIAIFSSYLQFKDSFIIPALVGIPANIILMLSTILGRKYNDSFLVWGFVLSLAVQFLWMIPEIRRKGYRYKCKIKLDDENFITLVKMTGPLIIGVSAYRINVLVDRTLASQVSVGGVSALSYASMINGMIQGIIILPLTTAIYPSLSRLVAERDLKKVKYVLIESLTGVSVILIPAMLGLLIFAKPIINLFFNRGAFDLNALNMTTNALFFYSVGILFSGWRDIITRFFYVLEDTKKPMTNGVLGVFLNVTLSLVFVKKIGVGGLALATSLAIIITTIMLTVALRKKIGNLWNKSDFFAILRIFIASLIMVLFTKGLFEILKLFINQNIALLICICVAVITYVFLGNLFKVKEIREAIQIVKIKLAILKKYNG